MHVRTVLGDVGVAPSNQRETVMRTARAALLVLAASLSFAAPAAADDDRVVAADVVEAVNAEATVPAAPNPATDVPSSGEDEASLAMGFGKTISFDFPAAGDGTTVGLTTVFEGTAADTKIALQPTAVGLRALVHIESAAAPERFEFPLGGDVAELKLQPDGSAVAYDLSGAILSSVAPAWARDASGRPVATHYEIEGTALVQVINHRDGVYDYAITADPWWLPAWATLAYIRCQTHRYCRHLMNKNFWKGIRYALEHLT